mmetsp:Transcript_29785/g.58116  ORF Transcript_29785/g.58116 Transcript_29785/m.58116 type:complete len:108 (-) Transcript_29785:325-648(-)
MRGHQGYFREDRNQVSRLPLLGRSQGGGDGHEALLEDVVRRMLHGQLSRPDPQGKRKDRGLVSDLSGTAAAWHGMEQSRTESRPHWRMIGKERFRLAEWRISGKREK